MAKKTWTNEWYRALIKKMGASTITVNELWNLAKETSKELGMPEFPRNSCHILTEKFQKTGLVECVMVGRRKGVLVSITDVDKLLEMFQDEVKLETKVEKAPKKEKTSRASRTDTREAFIKYFRLVRYVARMHKKSIDVELRKCMEINMLKRISPKHVEHWAQVAKSLVPEITLPVITKNESGTLIVKFTNCEIDLLRLCKLGQKLYPDYKSTIPEDAFGNKSILEHTKKQLARIESGEISMESEEVAEEAKSEEFAKKLEISSEEQKRLIFLTMVMIKKYSYQTLDELKDLMDKKGFSLTKSEIKDILNACPEIKTIKDESEEVHRRNLHSGETEKRFWELIRTSYGPKNWKREDIILMLSMTYGEVSECFTKSTATMLKVKDCGEYGSIFKITITRDFEPDRRCMKTLLRRFRRCDQDITDSDYTKALFKEIAEEDRIKDPLLLAELEF